MAFGVDSVTRDWLGELKIPRVGERAVTAAQQLGGRIGAMVSPGFNPQNYGPLMPDGSLPGVKKRPSAIRSMGDFKVPSMGVSR